MGTNNSTSKALRNKAQTVFSTSESAVQNAQFNFLISEAQRNSAFVEQHFRTKLKRNLTSAMEISQRYANTAFFAILDRKRVNNMLKKADIF